MAQRCPWAVVGIGVPRSALSTDIARMSFASGNFIGA
jgi:hypothetical protein